MSVRNQRRDIFGRLPTRPGRSFGAHRPSVCDQLRGAAITDDATGCHHPGRRHSAGGEPGRLRVPHRTIARHIQQAGRGGPSGGGHQQVGAGRGSIPGLDSAEFPASDAAYDVLTLACIQHAGDLDAGAAKPFDCLIAGGVGGEHDRPGARLDRVQSGEAQGRGGQHHAGQIIALEDVGTLDQTGGNHQGADARFDQAFPSPDSAALHHPDPVVVVATQDDRVGQHLDVVEARDLSAQRGQGCQFAGTAVTQVATEVVLLLDQHHVGTGTGRFNRGRHAGRAAAGDEDIRVREALVEDFVRGTDRRGAAAGGEL